MSFVRLAVSGGSLSGAQGGPGAIVGSGFTCSGGAGVRATRAGRQDFPVARCLLEMPWDCRESCLDISEIQGPSVIRFVEHVRSTGNALLEYEGNWDTLFQLGLIRDGLITNAGALLFSQPERVLVVCERRDPDRFVMAPRCPLADVPSQALLFLQTCIGRNIGAWSRRRPTVEIVDGSGRSFRVQVSSVSSQADWNRLPFKLMFKALCSDAYSALVQVLSQFDYEQEDAIRFVVTDSSIRVESPQPLWASGLLLQEQDGNSGCSGQPLFRNPLLADTLLLLDGAYIGVRVA